MPSSILRRALISEEPVVIDNSFEVYDGQPENGNEESGTLPDLVQELWLEHPEAEQDEIEDAVQQAIDQLLKEPAIEQFEADNGNSFTQSSEKEGAEGPAAEADLDDAALLEAGLDEDFTPASDVLSEDVLAQAEASGAEAKARAEREAEEILHEADARAAEIEKAAYEKGYAEGLAKGKEAGEEQARVDLKQVASIVEQASTLHDQLLGSAESDMVALCLEIARKVIQSEVRMNPDIVKNVVSAAVAKISGGPRVTIKVNPADLERVRRHWTAVYGANYREKEWTIEADEKVISGGCVLTTKYGELDAQIPSQFAEIQRSFQLLLGE